MKMKRGKLTKNGTEWLTLGSEGITAIGNIKNKKGYQEVKINLKFLKEAIEIIENQQWSITEIKLFVKTNHPVQIGVSKSIGVLIAPIVDNDFIEGKCQNT